LARFLGIEDDAATLSLSFETVRLPETMLARLPVDTRGIYARPPASGGARIIDDHTLIDEWGVTYRRPEGSRQFDAVAHPLAHATLADLDRYPWPDSGDPSRYAGLRDIARDLREKTSYATAGAPMTQ
jgi:hypothetical protein